ncbi:hypothetical protein RIF29_19963 [Crotalaria pallida]|uniref:Uncharacterized protein n=1 Tax=Crotalaria pallida TaxID=3830 RepID=A0AAN9I707_CROPI
MATNYNFRRSRSSSFPQKKAPSGIWKPTVPRWEKEFCSKVGSVPWEKLVETKKYLHLHENVMKWDDSAGKEAFDSAKKRFWAEYNGTRCDIPLPDPDLYLDDIDWNKTDDPQLLDFEKEEKVPVDEGVVILDISFLIGDQFACIGWGDAETAEPPMQ